MVTADIPTRQTIVQMHHNPPAYSHLGILRILELTEKDTGGLVCDRMS